MNLNTENIGVLVIDVQKGLFVQKTPVYNEKNFLNNIVQIIKSSRDNGIPITYVQHANKGILKQGSEGWKLHPSINPLPGENIVQKNNASAFNETNLHKLLEEKGIRQLIVLGMTTHGCVKATCNDALKIGYDVTLVKDAHSSYSKNAEELIDKWNKKFSKNGVKLINTSEIAINYNFEK